MHRRALLAATAALLALATLTSCSALSGVEDHEWADRSALESSDASASVPSLVATDATDVRMRQGALGRGGVLLGWKSATGITRDDCTAGPLPEDVPLRASWWPSDVPDEGWRCGWWRVFEHEGAYYAWDHHEAG